MAYYAPEKKVLTRVQTLCYDVYPEKGTNPDREEPERG